MTALALLRAALRRPRPITLTPPPTTRLTTTRTPDPAHLAAYQRICGFEPEPHFLPPTYPHVLAFPLSMRLMTARDFPLPLLGLVHTRIEIEQHRPITPTETLHLTVLTTALTPHRRGTEATLLTEASTAHGELLWQSRSTYLARHKTAPPTTSASAPAPTPTPTPTPNGETWELPADLGRRYASVSGDRNPIHLHALTARPFGFPRAIAHGMWTAARCLAEQGTQRASAPTHTRIDFKAPVPLPSTVTYSTPTPHTFELRGPQGRPHLTGTTGPAPSDGPP